MEKSVERMEYAMAEKVSNPTLYYGGVGVSYMKQKKIQKDLDNSNKSCILV